jgi:hypothetical protein
MTPEVKVRDGLATVVVGDALLALWKAPATPERWGWLIGQYEALASKQADGIVGLTLILPESKPPDGQLRSRMQADFRRLGEKLRKLVIVPLGDSLWLSVVRAIMRSILLLSGQSKQHVITATVQEGMLRVREAAGKATPTPAELRAAVEALFKALDVPGSRQASVTTGPLVHP